MKSVVFQTTTHYTVGQRIEFTLLRRFKHSIVPLPKSHWNSGAINLRVEDTSTRFSKFSLASDISYILDREEQELELAAKEAASCGESSLNYILLAMEQLQERRKKFLALKQTIQESLALTEMITSHESHVILEVNRTYQVFGFLVICESPETTAKRG